MKNIENNKFFLYARKSTESDERQAQSLWDQIKIMKQKAKHLWIHIIEIFQESMSAKAPWRYKFNEMIWRVQNWEAQWIIAWKLDRLSRNPIDSWAIQYMLQMGQLETVVTNDREYNECDAWLLMSVENWMSNQFIIDLKKNVRRWMDSKTASWIFCWQVPEWYRNNKELKTIEVVDDNFLLIRKAWDLMLTGTYSVPQVWELLNNKWWYSSVKKWKTKISLPWLYSIFKNPFYTWNFKWKGEIKQWTHKPMITWEEYERVQKVISKKGHNIAWKNKEFAFTWMIKCWECWGSIVAEEKNKYIKATKKMAQYVYYRCSKRKAWCKCQQKPINLNKLEEQINDLLSSIQIHPQFKEWWLEILKDEFQSIKKEKDAIIYKLEKSIKSLSVKSDKLLDYLIDETISKEDYNERKASIKVDLDNHKRQLDKLNSDKDDSVSLTEDVFDFIITAKDNFNKWSLQQKKLIFSFFGENFQLTNWVLALKLHSWINPISEEYPKLERIYKRLEPSKKASSKVNTNDFSDLFIKWSGGRGLNSHTRGLKPQYTHSFMLPPHTTFLQKR